MPEESKLQYGHPDSPALAPDPNTALFLMAKFPAAGKSKTRLMPLAGAEGAAVLARAFLLDLLHNLAEAAMAGTRRVLYYSPEADKEKFESMLAEEQLSTSWELLPQRGGQSAFLADKLKAALVWADGEGVAASGFIGMDTPDISPIDLYRFLQHSSHSQVAHIKPADDGGYVALSVPAHVDGCLFDDIRWSTEFTCSDQVASLGRAGVEVCVEEQSMCDVDEPEDLVALHARLEGTPEICPRTWSALQPYI